MEGYQQHILILQKYKSVLENKPIDIILLKQIKYELNQNKIILAEYEKNSKLINKNVHEINDFIKENPQYLKENPQYEEEVKKIIIQIIKDNIERTKLVDKSIMIAEDIALYIANNEIFL